MENLRMRFSFQYTAITCDADLDSTRLRVKQGLRTFEISIHEIAHIYFHLMPPGDFNELIVSRKNAAGKVKNFRFYSNANDPGLLSLTEELVKLKPGADLRGMDRKEAFAHMKAVDTARYALFAVPIIVSLVVACMLSPMLIHGLDKGSSNLSAEDLVAGKMPESRNVNLKGIALSDGMKETTTRKGTKTVRMFFPVVTTDWKEGDPVHILVETGDLTDDQLNAVLASPEFKGVLRNVFWEGPSSKQLKFFQENYNTRFAEKVYLVELGQPSDLFMFLIVMGISVVMLVGVTIYMKKKMAA
ncbi:MAG TPA: hypothetical protein PLW55_08465 [Leptospiraceae bacterium]|nr:hypothetical protein [Leptospiraceae bacterium]HQI19364.1 hypothetical protein [Leptospiraceae bacterium]